MGNTRQKTNLEIWYLEVHGGELYIVVEPSLHENGIHSLGKAGQQSSVRGLENGILWRYDLPRGGNGYREYGQCGVECSRRGVWVLLSDGVGLAAGAARVFQRHDGPEQRRQQQCRHGGDVECSGARHVEREDAPAMTPRETVRGDEGAGVVKVVTRKHDGYLCGPVPLIGVVDASTYIPRHIPSRDHLPQPGRTASLFMKQNGFLVEGTDGLYPWPRSGVRNREKKLL